MVVILEGEKKVPAFVPYASATSAVCTRCSQVKNGKFQSLSSNPSKITAARHSGIPASVRGGLIFAGADVFKNLSNLFS